ncbi:MAG: phosphatidate cytidylyltransferase [Clostridia bacterium]|nr:phosphatidate cytidylyltransferase [Clostridia bacterium]MBR2496198.1 phosphatidate cytidylyltransferase [Clostridia bacterium]
MKQRTVGAAIFIVVVVGAFLLRVKDCLYFDLFILLLMSLAAIEMCRAMKDYLSKTNYTIVAIFVFLILPCYYYMGGINAVYKLFFAYFWATAVASIFNRGYGLQNMSAATLIGVYPIMMFALMIEINHWADYGTAALLLIFFTGPICDVFAYLVGSTLKGPKLFPTVSPKKTVSGAIGGIVGGILGSILVYLASKYLINLNLGEHAGIWFFVIYGLIGSILTEFGDLVESAVKRSLNIKDMGNILPGHGGIMDRFDGVLFVVFATYIYFDVLLAYV